jgi:hypothetical protein
MALVWLGKSLLAELTSAAASLSIFETCACRALIPPLTLLVSPLTEFSRLVRSAQKPAVLLLVVLLQPVAATTATVKAAASSTRIRPP